MKKLLLLILPVLALLLLAAPVAAADEHGNSSDKQVTSQVEHGKSADVHSSVEDSQADSEDPEANSEDADASVSEDQSGAQRLQFYTVSGGSSDNVTSTEVDGTANVVAPTGDVALVIQGNIKSGLDPNKEYEVWVRSLEGYTGPADKSYTPSDYSYYMLDTFTTNDQGHGSFHVNIPSDDLPAGPYDIQVAINVAQETGIGPTVIATPWNPGLSVTVGSGN